MIPQARDEAEASPSHSWAFRPGEVLGGSYKIKSRIAVGGMGEVYLCKHTRLPGMYVAKVLTKELDNSGENFARFRREAEIVAGLRHPNVVQVFDFNVTPQGSPYLVMEYLNGEDLGAFLHAKRPLDPRRTAHVVKQVASALQAAHDVGVVHRDLKPENVVLISAAGQENFVKVIDFGISISSKTSRVTSNEVLMGTPHFMSPEQAQGVRDVDGRSDQFSLATLAYLLLVGDLPFDAQTPIAVLYSVVNSPPRPFPAKIPLPVVEILQRALSKTPEERFPSVIAFAVSLETAIAEAFPLAPAVSAEVSQVIPRALIAMQQPFETTMTLKRASRTWTSLGLAVLGLTVGVVMGGFIMLRFNVHWDDLGERVGHWLAHLAKRIR